MTVLASACFASRTLPILWLPNRRNTARPPTGTSRIRSNQAIAEEGLRFPGMTPRATIATANQINQRPAASHTGSVVSHPGGVITSTTPPPGSNGRRPSSPACRGRGPVDSPATGDSRPDDAAETEVRGRGVDSLRHTGCRPVPLTVVRGAEVRTTLHDPTRNSHIAQRRVDTLPTVTASR